MLSLCIFGQHSAVPSQIWHRGLYFSRCRECERPMVSRTGESWEAVPRGYQVIWRPRGEAGKWRDWLPAPQHETVSEMLERLQGAFPSDPAEAEDIPSVQDVERGGVTQILAAKASVRPPRHLAA